MSVQYLLSWEFFGPDAKGTASHFEVHLQEFLVRNKITVAEMQLLEMIDQRGWILTYKAQNRDEAITIGKTLRAQDCQEIESR